jgi:archaellum component FlaC
MQKNKRQSSCAINKKKDGTVEIVRTEIETLSSDEYVERTYFQLRDNIRGYEDQISFLSEKLEQAQSEFKEIKKLYHDLSLGN